MSGEDLAETVADQLLDRFDGFDEIVAVVRSGWNEDGWIDPLSVVSVHAVKRGERKDIKDKFHKIIEFIARMRDFDDAELYEMHIKSDSINFWEI